MTSATCPARRSPDSAATPGPMDVDELVETHLRRSNKDGDWPAIRAHGLLPTTPPLHPAGVSRQI